VWAGIGSEVAALTGAAAKRPRYGQTTPERRGEAPRGPGTISRDVSFTRDELMQIRAGVKEL
jgi:hypothetical protein